MHRAPALTLTLQPDPAWRRALQSGGAAGVLTALGWLAWHARAGTADAAVLACAALSALPGLWLLRRAGAARTTPRGTLAWQPGHGLWQLQPAPANGTPPPPARTGRLVCLVAGQDWLLLRHAGVGADAVPTWLPLSRRAHAAQWHALRCAVFNPGAAPAPAAPAAHPDE